MKRQVTNFIFLALGMISFGACQTLGGRRPQLHASLVTDSAAVAVYHRGIGYTAKIGFTFTNSSGRTVSRAGCGGPGWPDLEKKVGTRWVPAYYPVMLTCRTSPDFSWEPGQQFRDVLRMAVTERGHNFFPQLEVDSIDGIYRLHWSFTEGRDAGAKGARSVEAISNEFLMKLSSSPLPASNTR